MRILFMGTPQFAVPSLQALRDAGHTLCGVFTQPDRPQNRGMKVAFSPVKEYALSADIPVFQPVKMRDGTALALVQELAPDLIAVAAYGRILPDEILAAPRLGCINVHSSLLPKYRGAAPINWAILNGDRETGVTIMHMAHDLDAGDIIAQARTPIGPSETAPELTARLSRMGAELLIQTLARIEAGTAPRIPQDESQATLAPMLSKALSPVDWNRGAQAICDQIRGLDPWPGASTTALTGEPVKLWEAQAAKEHTDALPGTVVRAGEQGIDVACGQGQILRITQLQAAGGKRMKAADYLRGHPIQH